MCVTSVLNTLYKAVTSLVAPEDMGTVNHTCHLKLGQWVKPFPESLSARQPAFSSSLEEQNPEEGGVAFAHLAQRCYLTHSFLFRALHIDSWVQSVPALVGEHFVCATRSLHSTLFIQLLS